jgi:general L-amino acid transport system permease protein
MRRNLFGNLPSSVATIVMLGLAVWLIPQLLNWAIFKAVVVANAEQCQAARGIGACWGVITEKYRLIIFGRYPFEQQWRPEVATIALVALLVASCMRTFWKPWLLLLWVAVLALFFT